MAKKIDVHNQGTRTYTTPSGIHIPGGQTVQLDIDEGEALMKGYPRDLISPDSLRSTSSAQSYNDQHDLIVELQAQVDALKAAPPVTDPKGAKQIAELQAGIERITLVRIDLENQVKTKEAENYTLTQALADAKEMLNSAYAELEAYKLAK